MGKLDGKVALITGVARGQGRSHAVRLAEEGASIIGLDSLKDYDTLSYSMASKDDMEETVRLVEQTGRSMLTRVADVRDRDAVMAAVEDGLTEFGSLDIVSVNAGVSPPGAPVWEIPPHEWDEVIGANLTGPFNTLAAVVPPMLKAGSGGSIVVTSSGAGLRAFPNLGDYNASKFGVIGLAKTLAAELAVHRIRVNVICPGTVETPMVTENEKQFSTFRPDLENPTLEDCKPIYAGMMPMGEPWVEAVDVSNALVYLASDDSRYVTGIVLPVDQGHNNKV